LSDGSLLSLRAVYYDTRTNYVLSAPTAGRTVHITLAVHQSRFAEFLAKPERIQAGGPSPR
jgi:hypothetical protein